MSIICYHSLMFKIFKNPLFIVIFTIFLDALGFAILFPIMPELLATPTSQFFLLPKGASAQTGYLLLGLILSLFPLMQFFSTSILGQLSDSAGRKKILFYTILGTSFSYVLFATGILLRSITLLFISRALAGITSGNISVASASIADLTKPEDRAKNFGLIGAAFGTGFILGPFIGGKLSDPSIVSWFNPSVPFFFAAAVSLLNALSVYKFFQETNKFTSKHTQINWARSVHNILKVFEMKNLRLLYLTNFLFFSGFTFFVTFMSVFLIERFNFTQGSIGDFFSYIGLWVAFTQAVITRQLAKYFSEKEILRFSLVGAGLAVGSMFLASAGWQLYILAPLFAVCNGLTVANIAGLISRSADQKIQGEILGINSSVQALGQLLPPILAGVIASSISSQAPVITASAVMVLSGLVFLLFYRPQRADS